MENSTVSGLRSRSRSKTPFLRSSRDSVEGNEPASTKSGRKTPVKRSTPIKQQQNANTLGKATPEPPIIEIDDDHVSPPAHRTRQSIRSVPEKTAGEKLIKTSDYSSEESHVSPPAHRTRQPIRSVPEKTAGEKLIKTSDYSSEESPDRMRKEVAQNQLNYQYEYERVSTTKRGYETGSLADATPSPIHASYNVNGDRSLRLRTPAYSACSTDSSFAEQALADASHLIDREHGSEHLPYRLYKMAGEYWNKYPKTDYTYSSLSKDRVELAPGQVAVPNMSRRSLSQFRLHGPTTSADEVDQVRKTTYTAANTLRKRYTSLESSDDEISYARGNGGYVVAQQRWWLTRLLVAMVTTITETTSGVYRRIVGPARRYPYTERSANGPGIAASAASIVTAPFYWIYTIIQKVVTTTITTVTETVTPSSANHVAYQTSSARYQAQRVERRRRWWPWILLLLLPLLGYGCYNYVDVNQLLPQSESKHGAVTADTYKPPQIIQDPNLSKRIAELENWAQSVNTKLLNIDHKLSKLDNLEAQIESYSLRHLQNNLLQIFNVDSANGEAVAAKLKAHFDKLYVTKDQMQTMSQEIHERLINSWKPEMDDEKIRQIVQEYLSVFEKRQLEIVLERVREFVKEVHTKEVHHHHVGAGFDAEAVNKIVAGMLEIYDADKTGTVDFALESAGGQVISTKCTELYQIKTKQYSILGLPVWWVYTSPRFALTPGAMPAECWAFQGFPGYLVIRTYAIIEVTGFSLEHMSRLLAADGKIESAPKNFTVYGLRDELDPEPHLFGDYMYDANGTSIQHFPVKYPKTENIGGTDYPIAYDIFELRVESNYGNPTYTCVYRFRVHGNPLSDVRRATDDSIRGSERD